MVAAADAATVAVVVAALWWLFFNVEFQQILRTIKFSHISKW